MANVFAWASISEKGTVNGKKGDQKQGSKDSRGNDTKGEVKCGDYYDFGQKFVIRFKIKSYGQKAAEFSKMIANSNLIGYGQSDRETLFSACAKLGWNINKIKKAIEDGKFPKCNTDCSALCACAINVAFGTKMVDCFTTSTALNSTVSRYPKQFSKVSVADAKKGWKKGDMPCAPGHHIIINV